MEYGMNCENIGNACELILFVKPNLNPNLRPWRVFRSLTRIGYQRDIVVGSKGWKTSGPVPRQTDTGLSVKVTRLSVPYVPYICIQPSLVGRVTAVSIHRPRYIYNNCLCIFFTCGHAGWPRREKIITYRTNTILFHRLEVVGFIVTSTERSRACSYIITCTIST